MPAVIASQITSRLDREGGGGSDDYNGLPLTKKLFEPIRVHVPSQEHAEAHGDAAPMEDVGR
jgi:hypothetical protein